MSPQPRTLCLLCLFWAIVCPGPLTTADDAPAAVGATPSPADVPPGLFVQLGCRDAATLTAWAADGGKLVHGLSEDTADVRRVREQLADAGLLGPASADVGRYEALPYADDLVNLLMTDRLGALMHEGLTFAEALRVLRPGGVALLGDARADAVSPEALAAALAEAGIDNATITRDNGLRVRFIKPRPEATDQWTHFEHDASRTSVSSDEAVGPPSSVRWIAGARAPGLRYANKLSAAIVSASGRNFYWYTDRRSENASRLECRDAYNGLLLWEKPIDRLARATLLIAEGDRVYIHGGGEGGLMALDAATGREAVRFESSRDGTAAEILLSDGVLVEMADDGVRAHRATTGELLWERTAVFGEPDGIVIGEGRVFCLGAERANAPVHLAAHDLETGETLWSRDVSSWHQRKSLSLICHADGRLLVGSSSRFLYMNKDLASTLYAVSPKSGELLWTYKYDATHHFGRATNVLSLKQRIWVKRSGGRADGRPVYAWAVLDPATGVEQQRLDGAYNRCYPDRGCVNHILTGDMAFMDLQTGEHRDTKASRGACAAAFMPANGLTYSFYVTCNCYNFLRGLIGFAADPPPADDDSAPPLERGPAWGREPAAEASAAEWPTLRHDPRRTAATEAPVPTDLRVGWVSQVGGQPTSPTVAGGRVFIGVPDQNRVVALDAETGETIWSSVVGGRVDSPPTLHRGLALFGCGDGWVYCVVAETGELVWRMRAAPRSRRIVVRGRLESPWPVRGSVLVRGRTAYFAAGRHTEVDGGLYLYAIDPATGDVKFRRRAAADAGDNINDVLVSDGEAIHLGQRIQFNPQTGEPARPEPDRPVLFPLHGFLSDNTSPGTNSGGMTFDVRPWAYTHVRTIVEPRGIPWHHPLKGNLLAIGEPGVYGVLEQWRNTPRPRHRGWDIFGKPDDDSARWVARAGYDHKPESLVLAGDVLFLARRGIDDEGGQILALSTSDGHRLGAVNLPHPPRWDGMAAAHGRLYLTTLDGRVMMCGPGP